MKKINYLKLVLDLLIAVVFALLFNPRVLGGLTFHETAGAAIGAAILMHILLNFRWVKNVTLKIFEPKLAGKVRFSYLINILLLIMMTITIVTGILISRVLFPNISVGNPFMIRHLHTMASYLTLMVVGVHVGVHGQWFMNVIKKMFVLKGGKPRIGVIASVIVVLVLITGGYQWYSARQNNLYALQMQSSGGGQRFNGSQAGDNENTAASGFSPNVQNFHGTPNGGPGDRLGRDGGFKGRGSRSPWSVIMTYFIIMGVIAVPTYYIEKRLFRKKRPMRNVH